MTKKELWNYKNALDAIDKLEKRIRKREHDADNVPTVKDKVTLSEKDYPYIKTHMTVDAPEPRQYTAIQKDIALLRIRKAEAEEELLRLDTFIYSVKDERVRQILTMRYVEHAKLKDVAIAFDMTEQGILKIINNSIKNSPRV